MTACTTCTTVETARLSAASSGEAATELEKAAFHPGIAEKFERYTSHNAIITVIIRNSTVICDTCSSKK